MNNSRPAFAASGVYEPGAGVYVQQDGMSIRAYFAARAPHSIPDWFEPVMPPMPKAPPSEPDLSGVAAFDDFADDIGMVAVGRRNYITNLANDWRRDPCYDLEDLQVRTDLAPLVEAARPALAVYAIVWREYWQLQSAWDAEEARQRIAQWPWAWADLVLSAESVQR